MTPVTLDQFLSPAEIQRCLRLWASLKGTGRFAAIVARDVIEPSLARINQALGQENDPRYLAYAIEYVFTRAESPR